MVVEGILKRRFNGKTTITLKDGSEVVTRRIFRCKKCKYRWVSSLVNKIPVRCPNCKRADWNRQVVSGANLVSKRKKE